MERYVAFLRGINVSGQKIIKMELLKNIFVSAGYQNVVTYIQSGNVVFNSDIVDNQILRSHIERQIKEGTGHDVVTIVKRLKEVQGAIERMPFTVTEEVAKHAHIMFLSQPPDPSSIELLRPWLLEGEQIELAGSELYLMTPAYGKTKLSNAFIEKKLGVSSTARNWLTVNRVVEL